MTSSMSDNATPWMDRVWTEKVLRELENDPSLSIIDYHVRDASSMGDHYLSEIHRISIQLQRAGGKENIFLIAKKLPPGKEMQKKLTELTAFPNEIKLFRLILPRFQAILEGAAPGRFKPFAARHIYSQDSNPYFLIFTDLSPEGFRMADRQQGLDLDHCLLVMETLGRYHAASVALHASNPQLVESFKENMFVEDSYIDNIQNYANSWIKSLLKVNELWSEGSEKMAEKLLKIGDTLPQALRQQLSPEGNRLNVLMHGDMWVNNLLFKYNAVTGVVEDIRFVDFQLACYTSCAMDLQYFIHTSPKDDVRITNTNDLLRAYHKELCSTLKLLGQNNKIITFQELVDEYERKRIWGFLMSLLILPVVMADSKNAADMEAFVSGVDQSELNDNRAANPDYIKIIKRLLPKFEKEVLF